MTWQWPKLSKMVSVIKDTIVIYCFCKNWHETAQEHPLFKRLPVSLKQIESFLHSSSKTIENFSNSNCDPSMFQLPARRFAPCIMCVQYRGGAQYSGGCSVPWGISWVPWGDILSTVGVFSTVGGYHDKCGGISWVPWGVFSTVGDIMSTVGGYLEYRGGCSVPWGISWCTWGISWVPWRVFSTVGGYHPLKFEYRGGYHDTCRGYHEYRGGCSELWGTQITKDFSPHGTEHPPRYSWYPPTVLMISPHGTHDIPPRYWTPPTVLKISPKFIMISPTVLNTPHGTQDIPPRYWTPPTVLSTPHGTAHTLYRVVCGNLWQKISRAVNLKWFR